MRGPLNRFSGLKPFQLQASRCPTNSIGHDQPETWYRTWWSPQLRGCIRVTAVMIIVASGLQTKCHAGRFWMWFLFAAKPLHWYLISIEIKRGPSTDSTSMEGRSEMAWSSNEIPHFSISIEDDLRSSAGVGQGSASISPVKCIYAAYILLGSWIDKSPAVIGCSVSYRLPLPLQFPRLLLLLWCDACFFSMTAARLDCISLFGELVSWESNLETERHSQGKAVCPPLSPPWGYFIRPCPDTTCWYIVNWEIPGGIGVYYVLEMV